ncbi:MAG: hypothetical protein PVI41_11865, partial [Roseobacter sp.]
MTLFRKVFQNQSRPAGADEALDEDELRAAFLEMEAQNDLLSLEPFECVAGDDASVDPSPEDDENSESGEVEPLKTVADVLPDEFKLHDRASQGADTEEEPLEEDAYAANETDVGAAVQSDEEIAACLDRALAASPVATSGGEKTITDNDVDDFYANTAGAVVAEPQEDARELDLEDDMAKRPVAVEADGKAFSIEQLEPATEVNVTLTRGDADHARADQSAAVALSAVPAPAAGRAGRRAGRVKTRLLGFNRTEEEADPFGRTPD